MLFPKVERLKWAHGLEAASLQNPSDTPWLIPARTLRLIMDPPLNVLVSPAETDAQRGYRTRSLPTQFGVSSSKVGSHLAPYLWRFWIRIKCCNITQTGFKEGQEERKDIADRSQQENKRRHRAPSSWCLTSRQVGARAFCLILVFGSVFQHKNSLST